ncbi:MAG TPA: hypothetical protein VEH27_17795 [Methylomirabilota bacterium]|nr:hypothetical protein [Methylomirabilota bacterium]
MMVRVWMMAAALFVSAHIHAAETNRWPSVEELIRRVIIRAKATSENTNAYTYEKETTVHEFEDGKIKKTKRRTYVVEFRAGIPNARLVAVNGKALSEAEQTEERKRQENLGKLRKRPAGRGERQDLYITDELASRYIFELKGESAVNGRPAWLVAFRPKPGLKDKNLPDRFLNRMGGELWIDMHEDEVACVKVQLQERASLWGGFLGTLDRFSLVLYRVRLPDGAWLNSFSEVNIQARKLFEAIHVQVLETSSDHRQSAAKGKP